MAAIRFGAPADVPVLVGYWHDMLVECDLIGVGLVANWRARLEESFRADMDAGTGVWFVAEHDGRLVGTCTIFRQLGRWNIHRELTGMLAGMYVAPDHRRHGIARALTERAIAWCTANGCKRVRLQASQNGRSLYESLGFVTATEMMRLDLS